MTDERAALLAVYDAQLRGDGEMTNTDHRMRLGPLHVGRFISRRTGFISYETLEGHHGPELDRLIDAAIAHFANDSDVTSFEWKTRGHDEPGDLPARLLEHGFEPEEVETVMMGPVDGVIAAAAAVSLPDGVVVREAGAAGDLAGDLEAALRLQTDVFGHPAGSVADMKRRIENTPDESTFWLAEHDGDVVCAGRLDIVPGTEVAGIWGGATHPEWRGRGIYRVLTAARARWASERGVRYLHSDSTDMSRPILERSGLYAVTTTTPYIWTR